MTTPPGPHDSTGTPGEPAVPDASADPQVAPTCYRHPERETWIRCQRCERPICPDCMRSAAVGFQCPDCVRDGARSTRQARTPYGGTRVADLRVTTYVLIGINVLVWLSIQLTPYGGRIVNAFGLQPQGIPQVGILGVSSGAWWQPLTTMFTHVQVLHIGFNMVALYFLGPMLEGVLGRARFLATYLVSGLAGSAAVMWLSSPHTSTVGASTAIFGLMGALAVVALKVGGQARSVLGWIALNLVFTFTISGISWQGHLGGLVGGALIGIGLVHAPRAQRALVQWGTIGAVLVVSLVAIVARAAMLG